MHRKLLFGALQVPLQNSLDRGDAEEGGGHTARQTGMDRDGATAQPHAVQWCGQPAPKPHSLSLYSW